MDHTSRRLPIGLPRIVVVGGGAGGLELVIGLCRRLRTRQAGARASVTLVDRQPSHVWKPRLHEIAIGLRLFAEEEVSYAAQAQRHGFTFVLGEMVALDQSARQIALDEMRSAPAGLPGEFSAPYLPARVLDYAVLVIATGSEVNDFGIPGVREHCHLLDDATQAQELQRALIARVHQLKAKVIERLRIAIIGAGATGVELASDLRRSVEEWGKASGLMTPDQLDVVLIEKAHRVLASADETMSSFILEELKTNGTTVYLDSGVTRVTHEAVHLGQDRLVDCNIKVWASGVKGHDGASIDGLKRSKTQQLCADPYLRALRENGEPSADIFCIGDCAQVTDWRTEHPIAPTAQAAHQQADLLQHSLSGYIAGHPLLPFLFKDKGILVSLGARRAVGTISPSHLLRQPIRLRGWVAKLLYTQLYLLHLATLYGWPRTLVLSVGIGLRRFAQTPRAPH